MSTTIQRAPGSTQRTEAGLPSPTARSAAEARPLPESGAVAVVLDFVGSTLSDYDHLIAEMGLAPHRSALPGCLFHWVRSIPDGVRVSEVWRDQETFEFFLREELQPILTYLRLPEPEVTLYPVHSYLVGGSTARAPLGSASVAPGQA